MANLPAGLYFIRTPNGPDGPEYHIRLEDDSWDSMEDMVPVINDAYPQTGRPQTNFAFFEASSSSNSGHLDAGAPITLFNPDAGSRPRESALIDWTSYYKISACKRIGRIPINALALNNEAFQKVTYKNATTGGIPPQPFRGVPPLNGTLGIAPGGFLSADALSASDFPIANALWEDLWDDEGNLYPAGTFYQNKGQLISAWIFQEQHSSNLPLGNGTARWRWRLRYAETEASVGAGPYTDVILATGSFAVDPSNNHIVPGSGYSPTTTQRTAIADGSGNSCDSVTRLEYSPDGVTWPPDPPGGSPTG